MIFFCNPKNRTSCGFARSSARSVYISFQIAGSGRSGRPDCWIWTLWVQIGRSGRSGSPDWWIWTLWESRLLDLDAMGVQIAGSGRSFFSTFQKPPGASRSLQEPLEASSSLQKHPGASRNLQKSLEAATSLQEPPGEEPPEACKSLQKARSLHRSLQKSPEASGSFQWELP